MTWESKPPTPEGLSPRVRGKPATGAGRQCGQRSIPACAGEAGRPGWRFLMDAVYPRVCGGSAASSVIPRAFVGLSPRVRGKLGGDGVVGVSVRSIPACAGEASMCNTRIRLPSVYPRVCGGSG